MSQDAHTERLKKAIGRAAVAGVTLHRVEGGFVPELYVLSRWGLTREFTRLEDVEAWLDLVTGKRQEAAE